MQYITEQESESISLEVAAELQRNKVPKYLVDLAFGTLFSEYSLVSFFWGV